MNVSDKVTMAAAMHAEVASNPDGVLVRTVAARLGIALARLQEMQASMPYSATAGLVPLPAHGSMAETLDVDLLEVLETLADNLGSLRAQVRMAVERHGDNMAELTRHRQAIRGLRILRDLVDGDSLG